MGSLNVWGLKGIQFGRLQRGFFTSGCASLAGGRSSWSGALAFGRNGHFIQRTRSRLSLRSLVNSPRLASLRRSPQKAGSDLERTRGPYSFNDILGPLRSSPRASDSWNRALDQGYLYQLSRGRALQERGPQGLLEDALGAGPQRTPFGHPQSSKNRDLLMFTSL